MVFRIHEVELSETLKQVPGIMKSSVDEVVKSRYAKSGVKGEEDGTASRAKHVKFVKEKKKWTTKLSLPKFIAVNKKLIKDQRRYVREIGFAVLLALKCETLPKDLLSWLGMQFDIETGCIKLGGTAKLKLTPMVIHLILGIPYGGKPLPKKDTELATMIVYADAGVNPTINHLSDLIVPGMEEETFKRVWCQY